MLEVNVYDNFNPNYLNVKDYKLPNGNMKITCDDWREFAEIEFKHCKNTEERRKQCLYNALLISKAPEMLEKLKECIDILDVKCTDGCINKTWIDFQNGNGEDIGIEIDRFIKESKQLIKEATEL